MKDDFFKQYPYLCSTFSINKNTKIERKTVEAGELISPDRLDFMAKLLWIEAFEGRGDKAEADKLYEAHFNCQESSFADGFPLRCRSNFIRSREHQVQ